MKLEKNYIKLFVKIAVVIALLIYCSTTVFASNVSGKADTRYSGATEKY